MSDVDRRILGYMACHPLVLVSHVRALLGVQEREVTEHLDALVAAGLVRNGPRLRHQRAGYQITAGGLREIGSELPVPRLALRRYWQDIGVAWLSVAAHGGKFGEVDRVYCEREMRVADDMSAPGGQPVDPGWSPAVRSKAAEASFGIRLDGAASNPQAPVHYPDVVLVLPQGRVAVELQLSPVSAGSLETLLIAYALKSSIAVVLYLVQDGVIGDAVQAAAARLGLARLVHVQRFRLDLAAP